LERIARLLLRKAGQVRLKQAFTPRRLTACPTESEQLEGKSTTPHYLVNGNNVFENRSDFVEQFIAFASVHFLTPCKVCNGFISFK
jgi:hypothetical protein